MVTSFLNRFAPINFDRYIDRLTDRFTGREWLFEQHIDPWLQQQGKEQFYLLTGEPGVGKSAIVAQLVKRWKAQHQDSEQGKLAAYHFCRAGDVETVRPGRVLRSIAAQLGKTLPHYGKALNKVLEQVHLKIDVNINIDTLSNSQVTGIYIENLKDLDPREELRLLIQAPLAELPEIYKGLPEEERTTLPTLKVFLIDSLDEAVTTTGGDSVATLLAALSQTNDLPSWIRFILTARPGILKARLGSDTALQFQSLKHYELEKLLAENLTDIEQYVTRRVRETLDQPEAKFQARLEQAQLSAEALVQEVRDLSKGNFLYTRLVMDGIGTGELSLKNLSALPKNLYEVYQRFLRHRCSVRKWIHLYQPLLGTLTVTQEAISSAQLAKFAKVASEQVESVSQVESAIAILQQFLDEVENNEGQKLYTIFHQSLREYLLDKNHNQDFWCDAKEQHDNIIECCEKESEGWEDLRAIDSYGLRHLAQHLVKGDRVDRLHWLLSQEKNGRNAWFDAKDRIGAIAGFVSDVKLAWSKADEGLKQQPEKAVRLQCSYALMIASVNSLANNISTTLLLALVEEEMWIPEKALAYAQQIPNYLHKVEALAKLSDYLPDTLKQVVLVEALDAAYLVSDEILDFSQMRVEFEGIRLAGSPSLLQHKPIIYSPSKIPVLSDIREESDRTKAMIVLSEKLPVALLPRALEAISTIRQAYDRAMALCALAKQFVDVLPQAQATIAEIQDSYYRTQPLLTLIDRFPETSSKVLETAQKIENRYHRAQILLLLVDKFPAVFSEVLEVVREIQNGRDQAAILGALSINLPDKLLPQALEITYSIQDESCRAETLGVLAARLPDELLCEVLKASGALQNEAHRSHLLAMLGTIVADQFLPQISEATLTIQNEEYRAKVLCTLANRVSELFDQALAVVYNIQNEHSRARSLCILVDQYPNVSSQILDLINSITDSDNRALILCELVNQYPDLYMQILDIVKEIRKDQSRVEILSRLVTDTSIAQLPHLLKAVKMIGSIEDRNKVLDALAGRFRSRLQQMVEVASIIQDDAGQSAILYALAKQYPDTVSEGLKIVGAIQNDYIRADFVRKMIGTMPESLLPQVLKIVGEKRGQQIEILVLLARKNKELFPSALDALFSMSQEQHAIQKDFKFYLSVLSNNLPTEWISLALDKSAQIEDENDRANFLSGLIDRIPKNLTDRVLEAAYAIQSEYYCATVLTALARKFPDRLPLALKAAAKIEDSYDRAEVLCPLADKSPEAYDQILEALSTIEHEYYRARILCGLVDQFPELLPQALEAASSVRNFLRNELLHNLIPKFPDSWLEKVLEVTFTIKEITVQVELLCQLIQKAFDSLLPQLLEATAAIRDKYQRSQVIYALANRFPNIFFQVSSALVIEQDELKSTDILSIVANRLPAAVSPHAIASVVQNRYQYVKLLSALTSEFPVVFSQALSTTEAIRSKSDRVELLESLIANLPASFLPQALSATASIENDEYRADVLCALMNKIPSEYLSQALDMVTRFESEESRTKLLKILITKLSGKLLFEALDMIAKIQDATCYFEVLGALTTITNDTLVLSRVFETAIGKLPTVIATQDSTQRIKIYEIFISKMSYLSSDQLLNFWALVLRSFANYDRSSVFKELAALVPLFTLIEGEISGVELVKAVQRASQCWS